MRTFGWQTRKHRSRAKSRPIEKRKEEIQGRTAVAVGHASESDTRPATQGNGEDSPNGDKGGFGGVDLPGGGIVEIRCAKRTS